jgi:hypothetical protein
MRFATGLFAFAVTLVAAVATHAQCALPYNLGNGQTANATQVMANYNALVTCLNPGGSTNAVQYNAGGGNLAGVGPLTNGQLVVGSTGAAPQAQTLTAGTDIAITNGAGSVSIAATGGVGLNGLYRQVMSAVPTSSGTGLTTWLNQGSATVSDTLAGVTLSSPSNGAVDSIAGRYRSAPATPYTFTALVASTRNSNGYNAIGLGWYDGSAKLHTLHYQPNNGAAPFFQVVRWATVSSVSAIDVTSPTNGFSQPIWLQIKDDGTNVTFGFSQDGANFLAVYSVAKASGYLGASGYSNVIFYINARSGATIGTLMSWTQS